MNGQLIPLGGGDPIPLLKKKIIIGRRPDCDICLAFPNVSGHHCELRYADGVWLIKDLRSSNGVKVNDIKIEKKKLAPGDTLVIARHHRYKIEYTPPKGVVLEKEPGESVREESDVFSRSLLEKAGLKQEKQADFDSDLWKDEDAATPDVDPDTGVRRYTIDD